MKHLKCVIAILVVAFLANSCSHRPLFTKKKMLMGTVVEVISPYPEAAAIVFDEIERIEKICSAYLPDSAVTHLNKTGFLNTNYEVSFLLERAKTFYDATDGLFDITIFPIAKLWKESFATRQLPSRDDVQKTLLVVGMDNVHLDHESKTIKLKKKGTEIDLGALAKGYAVDAAVKELKRNGIDSAVVNVGGHIYCLGKKNDRFWKVGLQHPRKQNTFITSLSLYNQAVATSGDYQQFMDVDGHRYHHIINPKTGYPVDNSVVSVSVVAKDALTADAVATSIFLLGKREGIERFAKFPGVESIIVLAKSDL